MKAIKTIGPGKRVKLGIPIVHLKEGVPIVKEKTVKKEEEVGNDTTAKTEAKTIDAEIEEFKAEITVNIGRESGENRQFYKSINLVF